MKASKRILGMVLALALVFSLSVAAFAKTSSAGITAPGDDFIAFSIEAGTRTVNFTANELKGQRTHPPDTATYAAKVNREHTTEDWTGVRLADLLTAAETKLGVKLADDYRLSAIAADGFVSAFTVGDVRDAANNYMVAAEAVSNTDGETVYPNSYARIMRGDADSMPNQSNIRCITGITVTDAAGAAIAAPAEAGGGEVAHAGVYSAVPGTAGRADKLYYYTR